jgi:hypothetical protein
MKNDLESVKKEFLDLIEEPDTQRHGKAVVRFLREEHEQVLWTAAKYFCRELMEYVNVHDPIPTLGKPDLEPKRKKSIDAVVSRVAAALDYGTTDAAAACIVVLEATAKIARTSGEYKAIYNDLSRVAHNIIFEIIFQDLIDNPR